MMRTILTDVKGFTPVIDVIVDDLGLMPALVFGNVWRYCQMEDRVCAASLDTIRQRIGVSTKTVQRHIKDLCEHGYLLDTTPHRRNAPHIYADTGQVKIAGLLSATRTESPVNKAIGRTESPTRSDRESYLGRTESPLKIHSKIHSKKASSPSAKAKATNPTSSKSKLLPTTKQSRMMFGRLQANAQARGRRGPQRFPTLEVKQKFDAAAARLNGQFENALNAALEQGIGSVVRVTNYIAKWNSNGGGNGNGQRRQQQTYRHNIPTEEEKADIRRQLAEQKERREQRAGV